MIRWLYQFMQPIEIDPPLHEQQLGRPRPIRLYATDEKALDNLSARTGKTVVELTRKAVHAGIHVLDHMIPETNTTNTTNTTQHEDRNKRASNLAENG